MPCVTNVSMGFFHRLGKMSFFLIWIKAIFIIALVFPHYSGEYIFLVLDEVYHIS